MIIEEGESSSCTIILSTPSLDRIFLHCPGTNDTFCSDDIGLDQLEGARIFHFGYPPLMRRMYFDGGSELASLMQRAKSAGLLTSLDMAYPDPNSEAGQIDWYALLERTLPDVDLFMPSLDEILFMLDRPQHDALIEISSDEIAAAVDGQLLCRIGERLIEMGVAIAILKLGSQGLYARTSFDAKRLTSIRAGILPDPSNWLDRELLVPCFNANVVGTTGAGDCTIAGLIAGLLKGLSIEQTMNAAVAVGAFNVESADATSGVPNWDTVQARIHAGWERRPSSISLQGWQYNPTQCIWRGPKDKGGG
jgi:sugar/nucleoside kinase (ribokinase family)